MVFLSQNQITCKIDEKGEEQEAQNIKFLLGVLPDFLGVLEHVLQFVVISITMLFHADGCCKIIILWGV
jgi:hypothetical protein